MKITVVTPTFNSAATLKDTIDSVAMQDYPHIEHLIIDGVSKDDTVKIAEAAPSVTKVISEPDNGIFDAMNKGIRHATGNVVAILNSDDFYAHPQVLSKVMQTFKADETIGCVYGDLYYVDQHDTKDIKRVWHSKPYTKGLFKTGWHPAHPSFFVRKSVYDQYGTFYNDKMLWVSADYEIMLRFLEKEQVPSQYIPDVMVHMRDGGNSNKSLKNIIAGNKEVLRSWKLNGLPVPYWIFVTKPLSKVFQMFTKQRTPQT